MREVWGHGRDSWMEWIAENAVLGATIFSILGTFFGTLHWRQKLGEPPRKWKHLINSFYRKYSEYLKVFEIRKGRRLNVLYIPCDSPRCTIIFVHGAMGRMAQFKDLIEPLSSNCEILAYDMLGCGSSEKPELNGQNDMYSADEHYKDLLAVLDKFVLDYKDVVFVGHSLGTSLCMKASLERGPPLGMVLLSTCIIPHDQPVPWIFKLPDGVLWVLQPYLSDDFCDKAFYPKDLDLPMYCMEKHYCNQNPVHVFKSLYTNFDWIRKEEMLKLEVPILILNGKSERLVPVNAEEILDLCKDKISVDLVLIEKAAHQVMMERPKQCLTHIDSFFTKVLKLRKY